MATEPQVRIREIALATIVISGVMMLTTVGSVTGPPPKIGELLQFGYWLDRRVLFPSSVVWMVGAVGLLLRWNWARRLTMGLCGITVLIVAGMEWIWLVMPSGGENGESRLGLLALQLVILLVTAIPAVICIRWIRFLHGVEVRELCARKVKS